MSLKTEQHEVTHEASNRKSNQNKKAKNSWRNGKAAMKGRTECEKQIEALKIPNNLLMSLKKECRYSKSKRAEKNEAS